jgi:hypothetical protein
LTIDRRSNPGRQEVPCEVTRNNFAQNQKRTCRDHLRVRFLLSFVKVGNNLPAFKIVVSVTIRERKWGKTG